MEKTLKFNSQIATSRVQSERLLALGLKKETADMYYSYDIICAKPYYKVMEFMNGCVPEDIFPAWSLHRLLLLLLGNRCVAYDHISFSIDETDVFTKVINHIEWLIKEGYFNKEYLVCV